MKTSSLQENAELLVQGAQTTIDTAGIKSQGDSGLAFETGVSDLKETLKSVVDVIVDKIDVLAEVRASTDES